MPWYYAGPEAKPVGPLSLEELRAARETGTVKPETFIIEHTGQPVESLAWKRYQDFFPAGAILPPLPPTPGAPLPPPPPPVATAQPHPLFPSAPPVPVAYVGPHPSGQIDPYSTLRPTNPWCTWGFFLGLVSPFLAAITCGIGGLLSIPAFIICVIGLVQGHKKNESGQGLAIAGIILSGIALIISILVIAMFDVPLIKAHGLTVTEQTSNDSE